MKDIYERLYMLAPDGGDGGAAGGDTGAEASDAAMQAQAERRAKRNPLASVQYGRQEGAEQQAAAATPEEDRAARWKKAREEFSAEFGADVQNIVQNRLKNSKKAEETLQKLGPALQQLSERYGVQPDDIDGLIAHITDDDSLYEEEALQRGIPVETMKQIKQLEARQAQYDRQQAEAEQEEVFRAHFQKLVQQGEQMKAPFPNFDLMTELQNPDFQRLTSPEVGVDVQTAFFVVHRQELQPMAMQIGMQQAQARLAQSVASGQRRPRENGVATNAPLDVRDDPSKLTARDREEIKRRVQRGEKIAF